MPFDAASTNLFLGWGLMFWQKLTMTHLLNSYKIKPFMKKWIDLLKPECLWTCIGKKLCSATKQLIIIFCRKKNEMLKLLYTIKTQNVMLKIKQINYFEWSTLLGFQWFTGFHKILHKLFSSGKTLILH